MTNQGPLPCAAERIVDECVDLYDQVVRGVEQKATQSSDRAYGGVVRSYKGKLVEDLAKKLINAAWLVNHNSKSGLSLNDQKKFDIPIKRDYIDKIPDKEIRNYIQQNAENYRLQHGADIHVYVNKAFVLAVECKAFTENAMFKRILVDSHLLKTQFPNLRFALVQLESQLTGDYSKLNEVTYGSRPTHTLLSHFDVDIKIFTLLKGERKVDEPIHKPAYYKPLEKSQLRRVIREMALLLRTPCS